MAADPELVARILSQMDDPAPLPFAPVLNPSPAPDLPRPSPEDMAWADSCLELPEHGWNATKEALQLGGGSGSTDQVMVEGREVGPPRVEDIGISEGITQLTEAFEETSIRGEPKIDDEVMDGMTGLSF